MATTERALRPASRLLVLDPKDRLLLFRFDPVDRPPFWCTPGGALEPGESYTEAARRELLEETGIDADPGAEVARRSVQFVTLEGVPVDADERYFLVRVSDATVDCSRHTALERQVMRHWQWFTRDALVAHHEAIYPGDLPAMLRTISQQ